MDLSLIGPVVSEEKMFENVDGWTDAGVRGFIKRREAGIFPFYSGMFPLLLLINLYRVYRQILSNHPPTLP